MTHKLELRNVTHYTADANPEDVGFKYYSIKAQKPETDNTIKLILDNSNYIKKARYSGEGEEEVADKIFDCRFNYIDGNTGTTKKIFEIKGLKVDRRVEYDDEKHVFTATMDENQESEWLLESDNCLNSLMNDHLDLFI